MAIEKNSTSHEKNTKEEEKELEGVGEASERERERERDGEEREGAKTTRARSFLRSNQGQT